MQLSMNGQEVTRGGGGEWSLQKIRQTFEERFTTAESIQLENIQKLNMCTKQLLEGKHQSKCGK